MNKLIAGGLLAAGLAFGSAAIAGPEKTLTVETPIEDIVAVPGGKAVLDRDLPGLTNHAMYEQFKTMSLKDLEPMSQGKITDGDLKKVSEDLASVRR